MNGRESSLIPFLSYLCRRRNVKRSNVGVTLQKARRRVEHHLTKIGFGKARRQVISREVTPGNARAFHRSSAGAIKCKATHCNIPEKAKFSIGTEIDTPVAIVAQRIDHCSRVQDACSSSRSHRVSSTPVKRH